MLCRTNYKARDKTHIIIVLVWLEHFYTTFTVSKQKHRAKAEQPLAVKKKGKKGRLIHGAKLQLPPPLVAPGVGAKLS